MRKGSSKIPRTQNWGTARGEAASLRRRRRLRWSMMAIAIKTHGYMFSITNQNKKSFHCQKHCKLFTVHFKLEESRCHHQLPVAGAELDDKLWTREPVNFLSWFSSCHKNFLSCSNICDKLTCQMEIGLSLSQLFLSKKCRFGRMNEHWDKTSFLSQVETSL